MSLSATLTMLMSMTDIRAPSIAAMVIQSLLPWMGVCSATVGLSVRPDGDHRAHAGAERDVGRAVQPDQHRHALDHLHEVAAGVVRGEEREPGSGRAGQALHVSLEVTPA